MTQPSQDTVISSHARHEAQPRQPATLLPHTDPTTVSPHTQTSPSVIQCTVKPKHQQTNKQRHAQ